jgi:2'-5' RNA ligase
MKHQPDPYFNIFLIPCGMVYERLATTIADLSKAYHAPNFVPHVTLLGNLYGSEDEITLQALSVARQLKPFNIQLTHPDYQEGYSRCLFLRVRITPAILKAHALAKRAFFRHEVPRYMPHLSLLYGFFPVEVKKQIIAGLPTNLKMMMFRVTNLNVMRIEDKNPGNWSKILTIPFPFTEEPCSLQSHFPPKRRE